MGNIRDIEILEDKVLEQFEKFITIPTILFNDKEVLYLNESCKQILGYEEKNIQKKEGMELISCFEKEYFAQYNHHILESATDTIKQEILITKNNKDKIWVEYIGKIIIYNAQKSFFAHLYDITDKREIQLNLSRISRLRALMLEVTQSILKTEDINQIFQLILNNSLKALEKSTLGTILIKDYDYFTVASSIGFGDDIKNFKLRCEDSFIYKATDGKMDRIVNLGDCIKYKAHKRIETTLGKGKFIESTISVPIYFKGSLFGLVNVDSVEMNAFDEEDVKSMEFIRNNVEIAVSNHLLYKEKALLAKYDQLTNLYNRSYFEESFSKMKEKAIRYNETFQLVMFDIDELKKINDSRGHLIGDEVIKKIAQAIQSITRKSDILARIGGDEFIAVFLNSNQEYFKVKFQNLLKQLENEPLSIAGEKIICSFSYGIASFPEEGINLEELIEIADERMYAFKKLKIKYLSHVHDKGIISTGTIEVI